MFTLLPLAGFCRDPFPILAWPTLLDVRLDPCIAMMSISSREKARPCTQCSTRRPGWWMRYIAHVPHRLGKGLATELLSACLYFLKHWPLVRFRLLCLRAETEKYSV